VVYAYLKLIECHINPTHASSQLTLQCGCHWFVA